MAYNLSDFPLSTEEPRIEVNLPVGTHVLELVVEDSAGLRSLPDTVIITVAPEVIPAATISSIEPVTALRGTTFDLTIRGTGLAEATGVVFYTQITPTRPTRPTLTLPTRPTLTRPTTRPIITDLPDLPIRPINVADSSMTAEITERGGDGLVAKVSINSSSVAGTRTLGVITPQGTVQSGTITFTVRALPTITIPTLTIPTVTIPTLTIPTLTIPTLTIPTLTIPTVTRPTVTIPTLTIPTVTRPTLTVPTVTRPTLTIPTVTRPTLTVPTMTRPTLTVPTMTIPTVPHFDSAVTLTSVKGIGKAIETKLKDAGITTVEALASASPKTVAEILGYHDLAAAKALIDDALTLIG